MSEGSAGPGMAGPTPGGPAAPPFGFKPVEEPWTGEVKPDDKTLGMLCHLLGLVGFLGPLIIWLIKKDDSRYVDVNGKESLNFQLTVMIFTAAAAPLIFVCIGYLLILALMVFRLVMLIIAAVKANDMIVYRYPLNIRMIR